MDAGVFSRVGHRIEGGGGWTNRLAEVATALLVPPVSVRISELTLLPRGVDVAAILFVVSGCDSE